MIRPTHVMAEKPRWIQRIQDARKERWWPESVPGAPGESQDTATVKWILSAFCDWAMANMPDDAPPPLCWRIDAARRDQRVAKQLLMEAIAFGLAPFIAEMMEMERGQ